VEDTVTTHEERAELKRIAQALIEELRSMTKRVHILINHVISEADALAIVAADERSAGEHVTKKNIVYTGRIDTTKENLTPPPGPAREVAGVRTGKRACSVCRQPGHRAKNCPNAHVVQAAKKAAVEARPEKRKRGPVSPERRAKLVEQLKAARAARGSK
jgi:hypothetical protein